MSPFGQWFLISTGVFFPLCLLSLCPFSIIDHLSCYPSCSQKFLNRLGPKFTVFFFFLIFSFCYFSLKCVPPMNVFLQIIGYRLGDNFISSGDLVISEGICCCPVGLGKMPFSSGIVQVETGCSQCPAMPRAAASTHTLRSWFLMSMEMSLRNPLIAHPSALVLLSPVSDSQDGVRLSASPPFISAPIYLPSLPHAHLLDPISLSNPPSWSDRPP